MKKNLLLLTLLCAMPAFGYRAPNYSTQDRVDVYDATLHVEESGLLAELTRLKEEIYWVFSYRDHAEIFAVLGVMIARGELDSYNFREKAILVVGQMIINHAFRYAQKHLNDEGAAHLAQTLGYEAVAIMKRDGIREGAAYSTDSRLKTKVRELAHSADYRYQRHCGYWCSN